MAEAKLYGQKAGGMKINGIIEDYYAYAGENISAGDFVEFINGIGSKVNYGESADTIIHKDTTYPHSATKLDDNRVFIAFGGGSINYYLWAVVCTINGATITVGTRTTLISTEDSGARISAVTLSNGNVFIAHCSDTDSFYLQGMVCTIDGTTITVETNRNLSSTTYLSKVTSATALEDNKVFIAYSRTSGSYYLNGMVCTIDGTTITNGASTNLSTLVGTGSIISAVTLSNDKVFIAHSYDATAYQYLAGMACTISGTTVTAGTDVQLSTVQSSGSYISAVAVDNETAFISHYASSSNVRGMICKIDGTTVTYGTDTQLTEATSAFGRIAIARLLNGDIFLGYEKGSVLNGIICKISNKTITPGTETLLIDERIATTAKSAIFLDTGIIFIVHANSSYYMCGQLFSVDEVNNIPTNNIVATEYETQVRKTSTPQFVGVAKTSGEGGDETSHKDIVKIYTK